jgi:hypothetical protein
MNTEEECVVNEVLRSNLDSASQQINLGIFFSVLHYRHLPILTPLIQKNYRALLIKGQI